MIFNTLLLGSIWVASIKLDDCTLAVILTFGYIFDFICSSHKKNK